MSYNDHHIQTEERPSHEGVDDQLVEAHAGFLTANPTDKFGRLLRRESVHGMAREEDVIEV